MVKTKTRRVTITGTALLLCMGLVTAGGSIVGAGAATKVPGVTATQITIGATEPETGIASSGYNQVAKAANAVFKWVNAHNHGIYGRKIKYVIKDDCYGTPGFGCTGVPNTATQTHALLGSPRVRHGWFTRYSDPGLGGGALLKSNSVPQLFVASGSRDWKQPSHLPGTLRVAAQLQRGEQDLREVHQGHLPRRQHLFLGTR